MDSQEPSDEHRPYVFVGHHDPNRAFVDSDYWRRAQNHDVQLQTTESCPYVLIQLTV